MLSGMALERSFSFPLSQAEVVSRTSPFAVSPDEEALLQSCEVFQRIRSSLAQRPVVFCDHHEPATKGDEAAWLLHRDITHALILPILHIFQKASRLGKSLLCAENVFDLELAFRGEARGAFSWLQCFFIEEEEWCSAGGCPACVVSYVLDAEPTIRLILVASRLASTLLAASSPPIFDFWLSSLRTALDEDAFWGPHYWTDISARASKLEKGIQQLIKQCRVLEDLVAGGDGETTPPTTPPSIKHKRQQSEISGNIKFASMAKRQRALVKEEQNWMQKIVLGCWTTLFADAARGRGKVSSDGIRATRTRAMTS